ncbi:MAG: outer membrane lipoprotein-sorting protein [Chromatiaceae bacterium]|nr:outer membrane lipoprotein-sorting protein [Chromatiaceae bacterium]MCF7997188.1 outer membrane lipoprotein-sorting protein [Chromatiaceae bacterium]MCF8014734.1 outer membrane lipoprotein-sorting protein [Chromatiaceae bacterium]
MSVRLVSLVLLELEDLPVFAAPALPAYALPAYNRPRSLIPWLLFAVVLVLLPCALSADEARGRDLAERVYNRPDGDDVTTRGSMVLTERGGSPRTRSLIIYRQESGGGAVSTLIRFTDPPDIADTGLLTIDPAAGDTEQWVYLPALKRSRRISADRQGGRFVGSDFFYEDLRDRKVSMDRHTWLRSESLQGVQTEVLESIPISASNSVYGKRVSWIHPTALVPLQIEYYEPGASKPFKRLTVERLERIQGYWTATSSVMTDLEQNHETRLTSAVTRYDRGLPSSLFSKRALEDPSLEARSRP